MAITYSISGGADAAKFNINASTGALTFKAAPDFEQPGDANKDNVYEVQVKATDAGGAFSTQDVRVTVKDVADTNRPPQITSAPAISVNENQTTVMTITATDPDDAQQPPGGGTITLTPSGSITVSANNQVIEKKRITGTIMIDHKDGVIIRNCEINHPGGRAITAESCTNLLIEDCKITNTSAPSGQKPNSDDETMSIYLNQLGPHTIRRVTVEGSGQGIYAYQCNKLISVSFFEGHKARGGQGLRGQLWQFNQCTGGALCEDFSTENPANDSWTSDNINTYTCPAGQYTYRRGLIDGNNHPAGCGMMFEGTSNALVEDVDCVHMGNGAFAVYSGGSSGGASQNMTYRRCNTRDNIATDQGRGPPESGGSSFNSSPGCVNTRFEQCLYWNVKESVLSWDDSTMTSRDWKKQEFTPRAPIRNKFGWIA